MGTIEDLLKFARDYELQEAYSARQQEFALWTDYYYNDQIVEWDKAHNFYLNAKKGVKSTFNLYEVAGKYGPLENELEDGNVGYYRFLDRWPLGLPFTQKVINTKGCSYDFPPDRKYRFTDDETLNTQYIDALQYFTQDENINALFMKLDRFALLHGVAGVLIEYIQNGQFVETPNFGMVAGKLRFTPILAHQVAIKEDDNGNIEAVAIYYAKEDSVNNKTTTRTRVITKDRDILMVEGKIVADSENAIGAIPIVWLHNEAYPESFFGVGLGRPLAAANKSINDYLAHAKATILHQTQAQTFFIDFAIDKQKLSNTPGSYQRLNSAFDDKPGRIQQLSSGADINSIWKGVTESIRVMAAMFDIPPQILLDEGVSNSSRAIIQQSDSLRKFYISRQGVLKIFETDFWQMVVRVLGTYATKYFDILPKVDLKFPYWLTGNVDAISVLANAEFASAVTGLGMPLITPVEYYQDRFGDSEQEAEKRWERTDAFYKQRQPVAEMPQQGVTDVNGQS